MLTVNQETTTGVATSGGRRYVSLDLWRGIACLFVVIFHSTYFANLDIGPLLGHPSEWVVAATRQLWIGVPIFFVISGYCISATADSARQRRHSARQYFLRRFRRIFPPYWAAIALSLVFGLTMNAIVQSSVNWGIPSPADIRPSQWVGNAFLVESWRNHIWGSPQKYFVEQSWTLCYEEQFYLVTGLLLFACSKRFFSAMVVVTVGAIVAREAAKYFGVPIGGFFFDGHWLVFAAGVLVYYQIHHAGRRSTVRIRVLLALVALAALLGIIIGPEGVDIQLRRMPGGAMAKLFTGAAFALLISVLHQSDSLIMSSRVSRPLAWCGQRCYSLYLTHLPFTIGVSQILHDAGVHGARLALLVTIPTCVAGSLAFASLFYRAVESPFLNPPRSLAEHNRHVA